MSQGDATASQSGRQNGSEPAAAALLHRWVRGGKSFSGRERNCCFLNLDGRRFADVSVASGLDFADDGRAVAAVDWDRDGDLDLWIANRSGPQIRLLKNNMVTKNHFVAVRLQGTRCNRDAIGARVEVHIKSLSPDRPPAKLVQTLRAGEGFMTQTSKSMHFGLGSATNISKLVVRWPGGKVEQFSDLSVDCRYRIVEGAGRLVSQPRVSATRVDSQPPPPIVSTDTARISLSSRPRLPSLQIKSPNGATVSIPKGAGRARLLMLWAPWCRPCLQELAAVSRRASDIRSSGLDVLALEVSGDAQRDRQQAAAAKTAASEDVLENIRFPFDVAVATDATLDKLRIVCDQLFELHRPLSLPMSFLIDGEDSLAVIYRGPVDLDQLLLDVKNLDSSPQQRRWRSTPFAGRWHGPAGKFRLSALASALADEGFIEDLDDFMRENQGELQSDARYAKLLTRIGNELFRQGQVAAAIGKYREALSADPALAVAHLNLAVALVKQKKLPEAVIEFRAAIKSDPHYGKAHLHFGTLLTQARQADEGVRHLREAIRIRPNHAPGHVALARGLLLQGHLDSSLTELNTALRLNRQDSATWAMLGSLHQQQGRDGKARECFEGALKYRPDWPAAMDSLAWILATSTEAEVRDPKRALKLSRQACAAENNKRDPRRLRTLAVCYAANGQFDKAIETARKALSIAARGPNVTLADDIRRRLRQFQRSHTPKGRDNNSPK